MVSVACWALLLSSYSALTNSQPQDPTTGNLLNLTGSPTATTGNWVNGVYVTSLTCWQPGDPGNCGPNPNVYRNYNLINFSYGAVDLHQVVNINAALKSAGNNLQVTGFNFGFMAKNGNGWDNGQQDYLSAYVKFYKSNGSLAANYDYTQYTNAQYNWRTFNFSETFRNPSLATSYAAAQFGFIGKDTNNLAGPYGPEIQGVNFNLKYRVDPCATDPTSSPACPGFASAMSAKTSTVATSATAASPEVETVVVNTTPSVTASTPAKTETVSPAVRPQSRTVALALSLISKNQQQEQALQTSVAQAAVAEAAKAGEAAQQQAVAVAASLTTMSQQPVGGSMPGANNAPATDTRSTAANSGTLSIAPARASAPVTTSVSSAGTAPTTDTQQTVIPILQSFFARIQPAPATQTGTSSTPSTAPPQPPNTTARGTAATQPVITVTTPVATPTVSVFAQQAADNQQQANVVTAYIQPQNTMFYNMVAAPVEQPQQPIVQPVSFARQAEVEQVTSTSSFMTNRTDPLNEVVETKPITTAANTTESNQKVKTNVAANELAGNVDINKMATTPVGYSNYTNLVLKDGKMYEPKEIYKNQVPVDNARALRQLSTDRLHQQMIEQQYRR